MSKFLDESDHRKIETLLSVVVCMSFFVLAREIDTVVK